MAKPQRDGGMECCIHMIRRAVVVGGCGIVGDVLHRGGIVGYGVKWGGEIGDAYQRINRPFLSAWHQKADG